LEDQFNRVACDRYGNDSAGGERRQKPHKTPIDFVVRFAAAQRGAAAKMMRDEFGTMSDLYF